MMEHRCHQCGAGFKQIVKLKSHLILHEEEKTYKCEFCGKLFSKSSNLYTHIRTHTGEKPYQCKVCSRYFPRMNTLRSHIIKIHHVSRVDADQLIYIGYKDTPNEKCDRKIIKSEPLEENMFGHDETPCIDSSTFVKDTEYYTVHADPVTFCDEDTGSIEKQTKMYYKCKVCSKTMSHKSNMEDHVRSHTGIKLFQCKICGKGLSRKQNLVHHLKHVHFVENAQINTNILRMQDPIIARKAQQSLMLHSMKNSGEKIDSEVMESSLPDISNNSLEYEMDSKIKFLDSMANTKLFQGVEDSVDVKSVDFTNETDALPYDHIKSHMTTVLPSIKVEPEVQDCCSFYQSQQEGISEKSKEEEGNTKSQMTTVLPPVKVEPEVQDFCSFYQSQQEGVSEKSKEKEGFDSTEAFKLSAELKDSIADDEKDITEEELDTITEDQDNELLYIVLNPEDPTSKVYKCKLCGFECKRRYYMAVEHVLKHTNYKPYLCVVCCNTYSRKYTLRCHITKEHNIVGTELEDIMTATGSKVPVSHTDGFENSFNTSGKSEMDESFLNESKCNTEDRIEVVKTEIDNFSESVVKSWIKKKQCLNAIERNKANEEDEVALKVNDSKSLSKSNDMGSNCDGKLIGAKSADVMDLDKDSLDTVNFTDKIPAKPLSAPGILPSFFTSVYNMMNGRQPKTRCKFDDKIKLFMDLENMVCLKCNKKCSNKSNLKQHIRFVHINQKDFACLICGKKFNTKFNLKVHWKQHSDLCNSSLKEKFACRKCGKTFTTKSYLKVHIVNKHGIHKTQKEKVETFESTELVKTENK